MSEVPLQAREAAERSLGEVRSRIQLLEREGGSQTGQSKEVATPLSQRGAEGREGGVGGEPSAEREEVVEELRRALAAKVDLHPTPYTLHPTPYTPHPTPYTLHPAPYTLHPTPYTLHPAPYTPHPTPYTLQPSPEPSSPEPSSQTPTRSPERVRGGVEKSVQRRYHPALRCPPLTFPPCKAPAAARLARACQLFLAHFTRF